MGVNDFIKIGDRIKQLRKEQGISQKEMASRLGINVSTYSNYENNYREPNAEIINKIANELNVTIPFLLYEVEGSEEYSDFQFFIDYCGTLGIHVETCVSEPQLSDVHYVTIDDNIFTISPLAMSKIIENINKYIRYLFIEAIMEENDQKET